MYKENKNMETEIIKNENSKNENIENKDSNYIIPQDQVLEGIVATISFNNQYIRVKYNSAFGDIYMGSKGIKYKEGDKIKFVFYGDIEMDNVPCFELMEI
jgi:hypothetical protein